MASAITEEYVAGTFYSILEDGEQPRRLTSLQSSPNLEHLGELAPELNDSFSVSRQPRTPAPTKTEKSFFISRGFRPVNFEGLRLMARQCETYVFNGRHYEPFDLSSVDVIV